MKARKDTNTFCFETKTGHIAGAFNIYQSRAGAIVVIIGTSVIELTGEQCASLTLSLYELKDFDIEAYRIFYNISKPVTS